MSKIILHHFDISPFAEKVRLGFGIKNLSWNSVEIPLVMPKPDLTALTGGYRKTPVMQIGANIYCDTQCIAAELERRYPKPTLFPEGSKALSMAFSSWSDTAFFQPGAGLSMGTNEGLPEDLLEDRMQFFEFMDFEQLPQQIPHLYSQFCAHLHLLEQMLSDGRPFLLGAQPGWADVLAFFPVWMSRSNISNADEMLDGLTRVVSWERRVSALGHGKRSEISATDALSVAASSEPEIVSGIDPTAYPRLELGQRVSVAASDYGRDRVVGELQTLNHECICVVRNTPDLGNVAVHFPRIGYTVESME
ncbi:MAG: glutathione S-transferase family protein [Pseudomonadales bacterium]